MMMEFSYPEFKILIFSIKQLPAQYSLDVVDGERYYHIQASEYVGSNVYITKINSIDDFLSVDDFEQNHKSECNKAINVPGMTNEVQALMLSFLEGIQDELAVMNKRIEFIAESHISHSDVLEDGST